MPHTYTRLAHFPGLGLGDFRCCARAGPAGGEEYSARHHLAFVRRGVFERRVGSRLTAGVPNSVLLYRAGESHRTRHPVSGGDDCTVLEFDPPTLSHVLASLGAADGDRWDAHGPAVWPSDPSLHLRQWRLLRCAARGRADALEVEERLLDLLGAAVEAGLRGAGCPPARRRASTQVAHRNLAHDAAVLISSRFCEPLSLAEVAREVHASPFHLTRVFKRETGLPVHRFLTRLRLREALDRLAAGADDLTWLALDLGFCSRGHLSGAFRREFGVTPSALRAELRAR